jgi:hypothetical protein
MEWSGYIDRYFLELGASWRWEVSFKPRPLYPRGKRPWYPSYRRLGWPQSLSGRREEYPWIYQNSNSDLSAVQPVTSRYTDCAVQEPLPYSTDYIGGWMNQFVIETMRNETRMLLPGTYPPSSVMRCQTLGHRYVRTSFFMHPVERVAVSGRFESAWSPPPKICI